MPVDDDRGEHVVVGQVPAAVVRVVGHEDVALAELVDAEEVEGEAHRQRRGQHELRDADAERGEPALAVEDGGVALVGLVEDRRGGRPRDVHRHLEADGLHGPADDLGGHRVDGTVHHEAVPGSCQCLQIDVHGPSSDPARRRAQRRVLGVTTNARHRPLPGRSGRPIADSRVTFHCTRPFQNTALSGHGPFRTRPFRDSAPSGHGPRAPPSRGRRPPPIRILSAACTAGAEPAGPSRRSPRWAC